MKIVTALTLSAAFALAPAAQAHDFWLVPSAFAVDEPGDVGVGFVIGHDDEITPWNLRWDRLVSLRSHGPSGMQSLQASLQPSAEKKAGSASANLRQGGTHVIALESYHSFSEITGGAFNKYAAKEGLTEVIEYRERMGKKLKPGTELYARRAKAIVQVGDTLTDNALKPLGHTLEIVPDVHPVGLKAGGKLPVRVLFRGKPLKGALIDIADLKEGTDADSGLRTDAEGRATFTLTGQSEWKVNVVWAWPNPGNDQADFETIFTSLVFSNE